MDIRSNLLKLLSGNVVAQLIPLIALPFLARLYSPSEFGRLALYITICSMASMISSGRYDVAIISAKQKYHKRYLTTLATLLIFTICVLVQIVAFLLAANQVVEWQLSLLIGFGTMGVALFSLTNNILNDQNEYGKISLNLSLRSLVWVVICFCAYKLPFSLELSFALSYWLLVLLRFKIILSSMTKISTNISKLLLIITRYKNYPLYNSPHALLTSANLNIPSMLISAFGQFSLLGAYSQANRLLVTPWQLIANSLFKVYYKVLADKQQAQEHLAPAFSRFLFFYSICLIPLFLIFYLYCESFFVLFLGEEWRIAGQIGAYLLPWIYIRAICGILAFTPLILDLQKKAFFFEIIYALTLATVLYTSLKSYEPVVAISYFANAGAVFVFIQLLWYLSVIRQHDLKLGTINAIK